MIEADGGDLTDVEIVPVNEGFYHTKALKKNKADVATLIFANFEVPEAKAQGVDAGFFHLKYNAVPDFCQLILIAQPHKLKDAKEASKLRRLNTALNEASDYLKLNPLEAKEIWFKRFPAKDAAEKAYMSQILDLTLLMFLPIVLSVKSTGKIWGAGCRKQSRSLRFLPTTTGPTSS